MTVSAEVKAFVGTAGSTRRRSTAGTALKQWLSTWRGIGDIVTGMERQGYVLSLRKLVDDGWTAAFEEHRLLAPVGRANAPTPTFTWRHVFEDPNDLLARLGQEVDEGRHDPHRRVVTAASSV
jgi:hypothetical protein